MAGYNLLLVSSFVLCGVATFWVLRRSGASFSASLLLAGGAWAFSPFRWDQLSHLAVLLAQWAPVTLFLFDRLLAEPRGRRAAAFLALYALHVTGGTYLAYMIHVPLEQYRDDGYLEFALNYVIEFQKNRNKGMSDNEAYENIPYEKEALNLEKFIAWDLARKYPEGIPCECPSGD